MDATPTFSDYWKQVDTLLLDMDGTLLDLAFDNYFWLEVVPSRYARVNGIPLTSAKRLVNERYVAAAGTLSWYCIDHWTEQLGLDIRSLKLAHRHRITYLSPAIEFLGVVRQLTRRLILVTNAHRETLAIKVQETRVDRWMDSVVSSHDYRAPKESERFWAMLDEAHGLDRERCVLIDDSLAVLRAARDFGIGRVVAVRKPDSRAAARTITEFESVEHVGELI